MSDLKKCDFCESVHAPGPELKRMTSVTVTFSWEQSYGGRRFDMCGDCQESRGIVRNRTPDVHSKATLTELIEQRIYEIALEAQS